MFRFDPEPISSVPQDFRLSNPEVFYWVGANLRHFSPANGGWELVSFAVEHVFEVWLASGYSDRVFAEWLRDLAEWGAQQVVEKRGPVDLITEAYVILGHPDAVQWVHKAGEIHARRVHAFESGAGCACRIDGAVVQAWMVKTTGLDTGSTLQPICEREPSATRGDWVQTVLQSWNTAGPKGDWSRKDLAHLAGYSESQLRHWVSGNDIRGGKLKAILPKLLSLSACDACFALSNRPHRRSAA